MIAVLTILLLLLSCAPAKEAKPVPKPEPPAALLDELVGDVKVDGQPARLGMDLQPGMTITTGPASKANVLLYRGAAVRIDENTTVTVGSLSKQSVRLSQLTGTTWTKILRIAGVREYTLQTPFATATVRGTAFAVKVTPEHAIIKVAEGTVEAVQDGETRLVAEEQQVQATEEEITYEEYTTDGWVEQNLAADEEFVDEVVEEYMEEHAAEYAEAAEELGIPPEELDEWAEGYVEGEVDAPVPESTEELETYEEFVAAEEAAAEEPMTEEPALEEVMPAEPPAQEHDLPLEEPVMDQAMHDDMTGQFFTEETFQQQDFSEETFSEQTPTG